MKAIRFGNKQCHQIVDNSMKSSISNHVKKILGVDITIKQNLYLNEKNIDLFKRNEYMVSIDTFGVKYFLLLIKYHNTNYNILIKKKTEEMFIVNFDFDNELYDKSTMFDGEFVKNTLGDWLFIVSDIVIYYDDNIRTMYSLDQRLTIIKNILKNVVDKPDNHCKLDLKEYFSLEFLKDLYDTYIPSLSYKIGGYYFKSVKNSANDIIYIFPENRNDNNVIKKTEDIKMKVPINTLNKNNKQSFMVHKTNLPDIYELYTEHDRSYIGYAAIPDLKSSLKLCKMFDKSDNDIKLECIFSEKFNKWQPIVN